MSVTSGTMFFSDIQVNTLFATMHRHGIKYAYRTGFMNHNHGTNFTAFVKKRAAKLGFPSRAPTGSSLAHANALSAGHGAIAGGIHSVFEVFDMRRFSSEDMRAEFAAASEAGLDEGTARFVVTELLLVGRCRLTSG